MGKGQNFLCNKRKCRFSDDSYYLVNERLQNTSLQGVQLFQTCITYWCRIAKVKICKKKQDCGNFANIVEANLSQIDQF